jgi:hypothetical protein
VRVTAVTRTLSQAMGLDVSAPPIGPAFAARR